jgi:hypothetical protein
VITWRIFSSSAGRTGRSAEANIRPGHFLFFQQGLKEAQVSSNAFTMLKERFPNVHPPRFQFGQIQNVVDELGQAIGAV